MERPLSLPGITFPANIANNEHENERVIGQVCRLLADGHTEAEAVDLALWFHNLRHQPPEQGETLWQVVMDMDRLVSPPRDSADATPTRIEEKVEGTAE